MNTKPAPYFTTKLFNGDDVEQDAAEFDTLDQALQAARQFMERRDEIGDYVDITRRRRGDDGNDDKIRAPMEDRS